MKPTIFHFLTSILCLQLTLAEDNTLSEDQIAEGWQVLFDGLTIEEGWSPKSGFATFKVEAGTIVGTTIKSSPNTFLCSEQTFANFELTFEVK
ncbi:MAG: family 16 glycoside hydrolase, partial [Verrucomicrobiota bacterium]